ncbi:Na(+)/H(+) antiporter subunit F [Caloramator mitchellensis]|uniref:Na(+)/H(+) antiporter subunit F n=1 Tax=Caloramator mitchellensis TaxID=908809 RepID=A0A0R3K686_CALMK|nr:monovalent cation/H+ antiporter complex subunit F [Caloramator mitchellensis]KRQ87919.1 Na(+)/H(+) antiporter subunit F [Caloramator mitchellensis]
MMYLILGLSLVGLILSLIRMIKGESIESRVVAIDVLTTISAAIIVIFAFMNKNGLFLDVALVYGLLSFVGVVAIARYLEGGI